MPDEVDPLVGQVRTVGGVEALTDARLGLLIVEAQAAVERDEDRLAEKGHVVTIGPATRDRLIVLKTCALASRLVRTPEGEGAAGLSATYNRLDWNVEYARALNATVSGGPAGVM